MVLIGFTGFSVFLFLHRSHPFSLCTVFDIVSSNVVKVLLTNPYISFFGALVSVISISWSSQVELIDWWTLIVDCYRSYSDLWLGFSLSFSFGYFLFYDPSILSSVTFAPSVNSDHTSFPIDIIMSSKGDVPFYRTNFVGGSRLEFDVFILHRKYQVKPHSFLWFSAGCATPIARKSHPFLCQQNKSVFKAKFSMACNC